MPSPILHKDRRPVTDPSTAGVWGRSPDTANDSPDTANEVTTSVEISSTADPDKTAFARFRRLPERIRPEGMIATKATEPPPHPTMGRDTERDSTLRNAGC
jgi:hypothetical protein